MKYLLKKLLGNEIFGSMVSWATKCFFEKLAKSFTRPPPPPRPPHPSPYILNLRSVNQSDIEWSSVIAVFS